MYGVTDTTSQDYNKLWIGGESTGDLPEVETPVTSSPYYMVGDCASSGLAWNTIATVSAIPDAIHFTTTDGKNYTLTIDLFAGNGFKVLKAGNAWNNPIDATKLDGNTGHFDLESSGDKNVIVVTDGKYTFTYNSTTDKLTYVRIGDPDAVEMSYDIYIHGNYTTNWESRLVESNKKGTVTFEYTLSAGLQFGIKITATGMSGSQTGWGGYDKITTNNTAGGITQTTSGGNLLCNTAGKYSFTVTINDQGAVTSITISKVA